ncbi:hypothetical protein GCM10028805_21260 [Spirosoma harenae]
MALLPLKLPKFFSKKQESLSSLDIPVPDSSDVDPALDSLLYLDALEEKAKIESLSSAHTQAEDLDSLEKNYPELVEILKKLALDEAIILKEFIKLGGRPFIMALLRQKNTRLSVEGLTSLPKNYSLVDQSENVKHDDFIPNYLIDLSRQGMIAVPKGMHMSETTIYYDRIDFCEIKPTKRT